MEEDHSEGSRAALQLTQLPVKLLLEGAGSGFLLFHCKCSLWLLGNGLLEKLGEVYRL